MGNADEIRQRIISKVKNANTWYENAQSEHKRIINEIDVDEQSNMSSICRDDIGKIYTYISELTDVGYLVMFNGNITVHVFDEPTKKKFDEDCKKHVGQMTYQHEYLEFFQYGEGLREANLYIPPISTICSRTYDKYEPPSGDDGD